MHEETRLNITETSPPFVRTFKLEVSEEELRELVTVFLAAENAGNYRGFLDPKWLIREVLSGIR